MKSIRIQGLRSLKDTKLFDIKDLNILVGTNSSGKSSFLRVFPLLKQSVERKTRGPILWDGNYIDFGSFDTSVHSGIDDDKDKIIKLFFNFTHETKSFQRIKVDLECDICINRSSNGLGSYTSQYNVKIYDHTILFNFDEDGTITEISSDRLQWPLKKHELKYQITDTDSLLPILKSEIATSNRPITLSIFNQVSNIFREKSGSSSINKYNFITSRFLNTTRNDDDKLRFLNKISSTQKWSREVKNWNIQNSNFRFISGLADLFFIMENSEQINKTMTNILLGVRYIAPLRTSTARYYRYQDLNIDELDPKGENIGMFISNIPKKWRESLDNWTQNEFGFIIQDNFNSGHISINIRHQNSKTSDNMSDMGFGYSQVLPIIIQLWSLSSGYENSKRKIEITSYLCAIEQPELHLHPKMQASLANVFVKSIALARSNEIKLRLLIETHSESIISKIGTLVSENKLISNQDVGVTLFEQDITTRKTNLISVKFDENGFLSNWPLGFFEY